MRALIAGDAGVLGVLRGVVDRSRWEVPVVDEPGAQVAFLEAHPVPAGRRGVVLASRAGEWMRAARAGWTVYWCVPETGRGVPYGTVPLPGEWTGLSVGAFASLLWPGCGVVDSRVVGDVMLGVSGALGVLLSVASNTGGVGKTTTCRRLCERAAERGVRALLVDGNVLQGSQRSFFDPQRRMAVRTVGDWRPGADARRGANPGRALGVGYDVAFAPPVGSGGSWEPYGPFLSAARRLWELVVLDVDRIDADEVRDPASMAGGLVVPSLLAGDPLLLIVRAGRQTQADAVNLLGALPATGASRELVGVKDCLPIGMDEDAYTRLDYSRWATFLGVEHHTARAARLLAHGESDWEDPGLDLVRERTLAWAMPGRGFDPTAFEPDHTKERHPWWKRH